MTGVLVAPSSSMGNLVNTVPRTGANCIPVSGYRKIAACRALLVPSTPRMAPQKSTTSNSAPSWLLLTYLYADMELVFDLFRAQDLMAMNAAPGRDVVHDARVRCHYLQGLARCQLIDGILRANDRNRTEQPSCIKLVRTHRYQASGICSTRMGTILT